MFTDLRPTPPDRIPPGQIETRKWPVLHYSRVPMVDTRIWRFRIWGEVEHPLELTWDEFRMQPREETLCDIHCVTRWSRLDNRFGGVPVSALLLRARPGPEARHALVHAEPDYTTNLALTDLDRPGNLLATHFEGEPLTPEHGG
ncbi:MAG TPA: molybdopterin-dependent oxidoreductase, partial [Gemmatimonadales bacterium]